MRCNRSFANSSSSVFPSVKYGSGLSVTGPIRTAHSAFRSRNRKKEGTEHARSKKVVVCEPLSIALFEVLAVRLRLSRPHCLDGLQRLILYGSIHSIDAAIRC